MYTPEQSRSPLGRAWALHRNGTNEAAIAEFDRILQESPNDIDANFGLALTQRSLGRLDQALATLQKVQQLVAASLQTEPKSDRWQMLTRICDQRIAEITLLKANQAG